MKLPVTKAIATTLAFAAQHWLDALKIIWAPMTLYYVSFSYFQPIYERYSIRISAEQASGGSATSLVLEMLPYYLAMLAITTLLGTIMSAGMLKLVVRGEKPRLPFYLGIGKDEWRLFITGLVYVCIFVLVQVSIIVLMGIRGALSNITPIAGTLVALVIGMVLAWVLVRLMLRLSLVAPASIDTRRVGVKPGFAGTHHNEMHLLGYWLAWVLIAAAMQLAVTVALVPETLRAYLGLLNPNSAESRLGLNEAVIASARAFDLSTPMGIVRTVISWLTAVLQTVIGLIAAGVAWRMITDKPTQSGEAGA